MKHILALLVIKIGTLVLIAISVGGVYWGFRIIGLSPFWAFVVSVVGFVVIERDAGAPSWKALRHPFSRYWSRSN